MAANWCARDEAEFQRTAKLAERLAAERNRVINGFAPELARTLGLDLNSHSGIRRLTEQMLANADKVVALLQPFTSKPASVEPLLGDRA